MRFDRECPSADDESFVASIHFISDTFNYNIHNAICTHPLSYHTASSILIHVSNKNSAIEPYIQVKKILDGQQHYNEEQLEGLFFIREISGNGKKNYVDSGYIIYKGMNMLEHMTLCDVEKTISLDSPQIHVAIVGRWHLDMAKWSKINVHRSSCIIVLPWKKDVIL
ncbi:hypothetical protein ACJX0J_037162, partial [Zea mays]